MNYFRLFLIACLALILPASSFAREEGIAAVVNHDAITMTDLNDRVRLIALSSGMPDSKEVKTRLTLQVLNGLIEEQLMMQEAEKRGIKVEQAEIDQAFAGLAQQNKMTPEQFKALLLRGGANIATMQRQIRAQIGWSKVVQKVMRPQVTVTDGDIEEYLGRLTVNRGKTEYRAAEIFLPVEAAEQEANMQQLALRLVTEIRNKKAPFFKIAQQFSRAPGAAQGGDMGWVQQGQLDAALYGALAQLQPNSVSDPIRAASGYHILLLRETRVIADQNLPTRDEAMSTIGTQRLDRLQRGYMMDLKAAAFIEKRVQS